MAAGDEFDTTIGPVDAMTPETRLPAVPDFARFIPRSVIDQEERMAQSDAWEAGQRQKIGDLWQSTYSDEMNNIVQRYTGLSEWGPAQPMPYEPVTGQQMDPGMQDQPAQPTQPPVADPMSGATGGLDLGGLFDHIGSFFHGVQGGAPQGPLVATSQGLREAGVQPDTAGLGGLMTGYERQAELNKDPEQRAKEQEMATEALMYAAGDVDATPAIEAAKAGIAKVPGALEAVKEAAPKLAQAIVPESQQGKLAFAGAKGIVEDTGVGKEAFKWTVDHPAVQKAIEMGVPDKVAEGAVKILNNETALANVKKEAGRIGDTGAKRVALELDKLSKHADLMEQLKAPGVAEKLTPETKAALEAIDELPMDMRESVAKTAARESGMNPDYFAANNPNLRAPKEPFPGTSAEEAAKSLEVKPPADQNFEPITGAGKPPTELPPGPVGGPPPGEIPLTGAVEKAKGLAVTPGMSQAAGAAIGGVTGAKAGWDRAEDDSLTTHLVSALKGGIIGAGVGAEGAFIGHGPGGLRGAGERAQATFMGNLISLRTMPVSAVQDVPGVALGPVMNFAKAALASRGVARPTEAMIAEYKATGAGIARGIGAALHELNPTAIGEAGMRGDSALIKNQTPGVGQYASSASTRVLSAWTELVKSAYQAQEEAGLMARQPWEKVASGISEAGKEAATKGVSERLYMNDPNGWMGKLALGTAQFFQKAPGVGHILVPFARVPANVLEKTIEYIPGIGAANLPGHADKAGLAARQIVGMGAFAALGALVGDNIQGAGPQGATRDDWMAQGNRPYSIKIGGEWREMRNLPPVVKGPLTLYATLKDIDRGDKSPGAIGTSVMKGFGAGVGASDFLPSIVNLLYGQTSAAGAIGNQANSLLPWFARHTAAAGRGTQSDTSGTEYLPANAGIGDKIGARLHASAENAFPGATPPARDVIGRDIPNAQAGPQGMIDPFKAAQETPSRALDAIGHAGSSVPAAPQQLDFKGAQVPLDGHQQREFQRLRGQWLEQNLPAKGIGTKEEGDRFVKAGTDYATGVMAKQVDVKSATPTKVAGQQAGVTKGRTWDSFTAGTPGTAQPAAPSAKAASSGQRTWAGVK